jgi:hypothetical protein
MRAFRLIVAAAAAAAVLAPTAASACQWETYQETYPTPVGPVTVTKAHCVSP